MAPRIALLCLLLACSPKASPKQLGFIHDDYERARAEAEKRNVPLFVDVWASWCHTCLSVKQYVLPDPTLRPLADRYVWLAIDSERRDNAAFLQRFPSRSLPTLWVIEPASQTPLLKWIGAATAAELKGVLEDTLRERSQPSAAEGAEANALWLRGHRASAAGETARAIEHYRRALEVAPQDWSRRPQTVEALSMRLAESEQPAALLELAAREAPTLPPSTARLNVVLNAIDASEDVPQHEALPALLQLGTQIAETPSDRVLLDDRSSLYLSLISAYETANPAESQRLAQSLSRTLDAQASRETDAARRRVWDPHRVEAYLAIGEAARAIPMLERSEREVPRDYNAAARLARVYLTLHRLPEARAAIDRALPLSDGPRKLRLYLLKADILVAAQDKAAARAALEEALAFARSAQLPAQYDKLRQTIERRARELS
ncbi:MAG TPA: thioredoxin family protein [Polyangiales bacterium]|nr:thioredoxin family protein [Polyangiales bacterium]